MSTAAAAMLGPPPLPPPCPASAAGCKCGGSGTLSVARSALAQCSASCFTGMPQASHAIDPAGSLSLSLVFAHSLHTTTFNVTLWSAPQADAANKQSCMLHH